MMLSEAMEETTQYSAVLAVTRSVVVAESMTLAAKKVTILYWVRVATTR